MRFPGSASADLVRLFRGETVLGLSEWEILERYQGNRDDAAFESIVRRHGPMVLGVCRRALDDPGDVEDAFQATFLVLVRRAHHLGRRDALGPWLHGVALRVAARSRSRAARRKGRERPIGPELLARARSDRTIEPDLRDVLDQELNRLPLKYRAPLVLCYLEGRTHEEAATALNWPLGTVKGRLARGRDLMRSRLLRRGLAPTVAALASTAAHDVKAGALALPLIEKTIAVSLKLAAGQTLAALVSTSVYSLVRGAAVAMTFQQFKWVGLGLAAATFTVTTAAVSARQDGKPGPGQRQEAFKVSRLPQDQVKKFIDQTSKATTKPSGPARRDPMKAMMKMSLKGTKNSSRGGGMGSGGGGEGPGQDARSQQILQALDAPIAMSFPNETPLEDVLRYIRSATTNPHFTGIPIYVDPIGLQETERSTNSTVTIDVEGAPLRRTLQLVLKQLGLAYFVDDGILVITSEEDAQEGLPPAMPEDTQLKRTFEEARQGTLSPEELEEALKYLKMRDVLLSHGLDPRGVVGMNAESAAFQWPDLNPDGDDSLRKELRELINLLKAERAAKPAAEKEKSAEKKKMGPQ